MAAHWWNLIHQRVCSAWHGVSGLTRGRPYGSAVLCCKSAPLSHNCWQSKHGVNNVGRTSKCCSACPWMSLRGCLWSNVMLFKSLCIVSYTNRMVQSNYTDVFHVAPARACNIQHECWRQYLKYFIRSVLRGQVLSVAGLPWDLTIFLPNKICCVCYRLVRYQMMRLPCSS